MMVFYLESCRQALLAHHVPLTLVSLTARKPKGWRDTLFNFYQKTQSEARKSASKKGEEHAGRKGEGEAEGGGDAGSGE